MTASIFEIKRFAVHDGDGIRTTVFFKGCPLKCVWCHNPEGIGFSSQLAFWSNKCMLCGCCVNICPQNVHSIEQGRHFVKHDNCIHCGKCAEVCVRNALTIYGKDVTVHELLTTLLEDKDFYDNSNGGVTLSGGECLCQADFCAELLKMLKSEGIHTAVDTCGFVPRAAIDKVLPYTDVFLYDLKAICEDVHIECTGHSNKLILENLKYIDDCNKMIEIRMPFVPDMNSGEITKIVDFISGLKNVNKVRILPYHNYAGTKYEALDMENTLPIRIPSDEMIREAINSIEKRGFKVGK